MAGKNLFPSEGGLPGINPGSPFALGHYLYVSNVSPPFVVTGRLQQVPFPLDAFQSIGAPGSQGGAHSFVMGQDAEDSPNGARSLLIGYQLRANTGGGAGQADDQVLLGNNILLPAASRNSQGLIAIGAGTVFTAFLGVADSFGNSVAIGNLAGLTCINAGGGDATNAIAIGPGARAHGGGVSIGANAISSNTTAICIGQGAIGGLQSVAIGVNADATQQHSVSIGDRARAGTGPNITIGWFADSANSARSIVFGEQATSNAKDQVFVVGDAASPGGANRWIVGSPTFQLKTFRWGLGDGNGGNETYTFAVSDNFGVNNAQGNSLVIHAGVGTGNWANGENLGIDLQVGFVTAGGAAQQTNQSGLAIRHSDANVALWGGLGANFAGGVKCFFVGNGTTAPAGAVVGGVILYAVAGQLFGIGASGVATLLVP